MVSGIDLKQLTKEQKDAFLAWASDPDAVRQNSKHAEVWRKFRFVYHVVCSPKSEFKPGNI